MRVRTLLCASLLAACRVESFACAGVGECVLAGEPGVCVVGNCAYPDAMCPSGYRYAAGLDNGLAGECVPEEAIGSSDTDASTGSSSESSSSESSSSESSSSGGGTIADPVTSSTGSSTTMMASVTSNVTDTGASMSESSPTTTEIPSECTALGCDDCLDCALFEGCATESTSCASQPGCTTTAACLNDCLFVGICLDCCEFADDDAIAAAVELYSCLLNVCAMNCKVVGDPPCGMMK